MLRYWSVSASTGARGLGCGIEVSGFGVGGFRVECLRRPVSRASTRFGTFPKKGGQIEAPEYYSVSDKDPQEGTPNLGKPPV